MSESYLAQAPITLICPGKLKTRLMFRLSNWATGLDGQLDPGITIRTGPRRDRDEFGSSCGDEFVFISIVPGVFVLYGDPPFTAEGAPVEWSNAPRAYFLSEADLEGVSQ